MTEQFDSRALRNTDTYGQRLMKAGTYPYSILPAGSASAGGDAPFAIEVVGEEGGEMHQTLVTVTFANGRFTPSNEKVTIAPGDLVMWHSPDAASHPFLVQGEKEFFSSERLVNESGYTHAFTSPGEHVWGDAFGSELRGVVRVNDVDATLKGDIDEWQRAMGRGVLVMITDGRAEPAEVDIVVGQTVYFALTKGPGISITSEALLRSGADIAEAASRFSGAAFRRTA
jgi:plastocyanin